MAGKVYLVGAGPGDPGLLTLRGQQCIKLADVVLHDRLVDELVLTEVQAKTELIDVGKTREDQSPSQETINSMLIDLAAMGKQVVRLKGGDPFIFGRGGEEILALKQAGIDVEVVPGVTSVVAAPAYAGIPLTHRGTSASIVVVSGSEDPSKESSQIDWKALASYNGTLVILMGWEPLPEIVKALLTHGCNPKTPAALIQWGTLANQHTVTGTLDNITNKSQEAGLGPPVVVVVGEVVSLMNSLSWFDNRPLRNKRILITRDRFQTRALAQTLTQRGAHPIELPTIEVLPPKNYNALDTALDHINQYNWIIFTSVNGVHGFFERLQSQGRDTRYLNAIRFCAIGSTTETALAKSGIKADLVPSNFISEQIARAFADHSLRESRVLLPRAEIAGELLPDALRNMGAIVDDVSVYRTQIPEESRVLVNQLVKPNLDVTIFASSSSVNNLLSLLGEDPSRISNSCIACIGPVTAQTAKERGLKVDLIPEEHTIEALVKTLESYFTFSY